MILRLALLFLLALAPAAGAEDAPLRRLDTGDAARGWEAVGRLDIAGSGFCTGALVADDLVLTAAHCLFEGGAGPIEPGRLRFRAGLRNGRALAERGVRRVVIHPGYRPGREADLSAVPADLALVELDRPVRLPQLEPFAVGAVPQRGGRVGVVSYAQGRERAPSLQEVCGVLGREAGMVVLSCDVAAGASGAPVFEIAAGRARIVSVVSAKGRGPGGSVALGVEVATALAAVTAAREGGAGRVAGVPPAVRRTLRAGSSERPAGAKFVRP